MSLNQDLKRRSFQLQIQSCDREILEAISLQLYDTNVVNYTQARRLTAEKIGIPEELVQKYVDGGNDNLSTSF